MIIWKIVKGIFSFLEWVVESIYLILKFIFTAVFTVCGWILAALLIIAGLAFMIVVFGPFFGLLTLFFMIYAWKKN